MMKFVSLNIIPPITFFSLSIVSLKAENAFSWEPSISLTADLDEPNSLGFCIDIAGFGSGINCNRLQAHSCKAAGADTQFEYDSGTKSIRSVNYDFNCNVLSSGGNTNNRGCVEVSSDDIESGAMLRLTECDEDSLKQRFELGGDRDELQIGEGYCLAVGDTTRPAGPFVARDLTLGSCDTTPQILKAWTIVPLLPTVSPTLSPTSIAPSTSIPLLDPACRDDEDYRIGVKSCSWYRKPQREEKRIKICKKEKNRVGCPAVCGVCCDDTDGFTFNPKPFDTSYDKTKSCTWIKNAKRQKKCKLTVSGTEFKVGDYCRNACDKEDSQIYCKSDPLMTSIES